MQEVCMAPASGNGPTADQKKRILIVDDNPDIRDAYKLMLEDAGYDVTCAASGEEALALAKGGRFDLIVSDVIMPGMDGLDLATHIRSDIPPPVPPIILWSGFDITEEEALRRGALMFLRKPLSQEDVLDYVSYGIRGLRIDPVAHARQRSRSTAARKRAHHSAADLLARLDIDALGQRIGRQLPWLRSYFGVRTALATMLRGERLLVVDSGGDDGWAPGSDATDRLAQCLEVIETGSSLVLPDVISHPSFAVAGNRLQGGRFFAGVPLAAPEGVTIGVLCLADPQPRAFDAEDLLILELLGRRSSQLIDAMAARRPTEQGWTTSPGMAVPSTFQWLLEAELRLFQRFGGSMELALMEVDDPMRISAVLMRQNQRQRLAGGIFGSTRGAVFKRDRAPDAGRVMEGVLQGVAETSGRRAAGVVSLASVVVARIGASQLLRIAGVALEESLEAGGGVHRVLLRSEVPRE
jgi:CheY-like chemotaxis protein